MSTSKANSNAVDEVLGHIEEAREELAELCLELANVYAPFGREASVAERIHDWYGSNGIESTLHRITEDRANVVGRLKGSSRGTSLLFNAHLDTEASGPDFEHLMQVPDPNFLGGWRDGDRFFGHMVLNDRHGHSLFMIAARAIKRAGVVLPGDVILTSVAGETGAAPVDEYEGIAYQGKGLGTQFLIDHGVRADFGLVAETTDFVPCWHNTGAVYCKVTLRGRNMYTPRSSRPADGDLNTHPNAIVKAAGVIQAIEAWAIEYEARRTGLTPCGPVEPKTTIGAIRGGMPWRPNRTSPYCALYVDIRILPDEEPDEVVEELARVVAATGIDAEVSCYLARRGAIGRGIEPLTDAIGAAHQKVRGTQPPNVAEASVVSMWRDSNVLNRAGIPSLNFGPGRGKAAVQGTGYLELDDMVDCTKMYALTAMALAGRERGALL